MECRKFQEQITAAVDNALGQDEKTQLLAHLAQCPVCTNEFEFEKLTRGVVRSRCQRMRAPGEVLQRITEQLEADAERPAESIPWWKGIFSSPYIRPALGFAFAALAVVFFVSNNNSPRVVQASLLPANDVIKQSLDNFIGVSTKQIVPTIASNNAMEVKGYFEGKTQFPVLVPSMADCELAGGVLNEFGGEALAHVVYNHNGNALIYVYETCWETVQGGAPFHLAEDVKDELRQTGWYSTTAPDGRTLVMWTDGRTLCSAVSTLDEEKLRACLEGAK